MSRHDFVVRSRHMLDAAEEAVDMLGERTVEDLKADRQLQLALVKLIEIVGEAANRLPQAERELHPDVPWLEATRMRHRLVHGYDQVDYAVVHDTVRDDLPILIKQLRAVISDG